MALHFGYPILTPPPLSMSELRCETVEYHQIIAFFNKWMEDPVHELYYNWFDKLSDKPTSRWLKEQMLTWNRGDFSPENIFGRAIDTARLLPFDRPWKAHIYYHKTVKENKVPICLYLMLPEIMLLRGMHDQNCNDVYIILADIKRDEMDDITQYYKQFFDNDRGQPIVERKVSRDHKQLAKKLRSNNRMPCFTQIDLTLRALLNEKAPPFIIIYTIESDSYSQIFFTHELYVPSKEIYFDLPGGCLDPNCPDDCQMVRFPREGLERAVILPIQKVVEKAKSNEMCNWAHCTVSFGSKDEVETGSSLRPSNRKLRCSKCKLVIYCCREHQTKDWSEHRRVCVNTTGLSDEQIIVNYLTKLSSS